MSLLPLTGLADPDFIVRDPQQVVDDLIAQYETMTGRTVYPAQVERLVIDLIAYRESLTREAIQDAAKQNLVSFARAPFLDYLGELLGCGRLSGSCARTLLRFTLAAPLINHLVIPAGMQVQNSSGAFTFAVESDITVAAGCVNAEGWAVSTVAGIQANGLASGQLSVWVDTIGIAVSVTNISTSYGGTAPEDDDRYRDRVRLAAERPACGTLTAYRYHAMSVRPDLLDVGITSDKGGQVRVSALMVNDNAASGVLSEIHARLHHDEVKPLTDDVVVVAAERVPFRVTVELTLYVGASSSQTLQQARIVAEAWAAPLRNRLGRDVVPEQLMSRLQSVQGVYRVALSAPVYQVLSAHQWADCEGIDIVPVGVVNG